MGTAKVMKASEFKAQCLELMDRVAASGDVIVITKRGKPVAQLTPLPVERPATLAGYLKDEIAYVGDVVAPVDTDWGPAAPMIRPPTPKKRSGAKR